MALGLEALRSRAVDPKDYVYTGAFDIQKFGREITTRIRAAPKSIAGRFNALAIPDAQRLLGSMAADPYIIDICWMAYMLATAFWETTSRTWVETPVLDRGGRPVLAPDKTPLTRRSHPWLMAMRPVDEEGLGAGRNYELPVKVTQLKDGSVQIVEQDGDVFSIDRSGKYKASTAGGVPGASPSAKPDGAYAADGGKALADYGRGYVQLTWWYNYATSGVAIGRGLDLLLDPELAKDPATAYKLMAYGMRTGRGLANGHMLQHYFTVRSRTTRGHAPW